MKDEISAFLKTDKALFLRTADEWNLPLTPEIIRNLETFVSEVLSKNKKFNLISKKDSPRIWTRHILDSLALLKRGGPDYSKNSSFVDAGTGAGFPGICLNILLRNAHFLFLEPNAKRNSFLLWLISKLSLKNAVVSARPLGEAQFKKTDIFTERAMGKLENIIADSIDSIKEETGVFCAWQSNDRIIASDKIKNIMTRKNAEIFKISRYTLPREEKDRFIICFRRKKCAS